MIRETKIHCSFTALHVRGFSGSRFFSKLKGFLDHVTKYTCDYS